MTAHDPFAMIEALRAENRRLSQELRDLRIHLRDRDAYIRNLESQLKPFLVVSQEIHDQEPLL